MDSGGIMSVFDVILSDHSSFLCSSLYHLQQDGFMCDARLQGSDGQVLAHSVVLSAASSYLKETIGRSALDHQNVKLVHLENENMSNLNVVVELLYTGKVRCSKHNLEDISKLIKAFEIENVVYNISQDSLIALASEDSVIQNTLDNTIPCTVSENNENICVKTEDSDSPDQLYESPDSTCRTSTTVIGQVVPGALSDSGDNRNQGRTILTRKRKMNSNLCEELIESSEKQKISLSKRQLNSSVSNNKEKSDPSKGGTTNKTNNAYEINTRARGQRSVIGNGVNKSEEKTPYHQTRSQSKILLNAGKQSVTIDPRKNLKPVKSREDTDTIHAKKRKVITDQVKVQSRNKGVGSKKNNRNVITSDGEQYQEETDEKMLNNDQIEDEVQDNNQRNKEGTYTKKHEENEQNSKCETNHASEEGNSLVIKEEGHKETEIFEPQTDNIDALTKVKKGVHSSRIQTRKCWKCGKVFDDHESYLKHRVENHPDLLEKLAMKNEKLRGKKRTYCKDCDIQFDSYKNFLQHRKDVKHVRKSHQTVYRCGYCDYTSKVQCYLDMHKIKKHNMALSETTFEIFKCEYADCDYFNLRKSIVEQHMLETHCSINAEVCEVCGKTFKSRKQLKAHVKMHIPTDQREKRFECPECDKKFTRRGDFTLHFNHQHLKEKPFMCHLCPYRVTAQRLLDIHLYNVHEIPLPGYIKQYTCEECGYTTPYRHYLVAHTSRHKGIANFKCHICEKTFLAKPNLTAHLWRHNTVDKTCPYDDCKYKGKGQKLKEHIKLQHTHKDERPYQCPMCTYQGKTRCRVRNHLYKFHKLKQLQALGVVPQKIEINTVEDMQAVKQITHVTTNGNIEMGDMQAVKEITHVTTNGNIELDTLEINDRDMQVNSVITKDLYKQTDSESSEDSDTVVTYVKMDSGGPPQQVIVKDKTTSDENVAHVIVEDGEILSAIQDSKNVIILQHDGLQYGAIEVVDSQI